MTDKLIRDLIPEIAAAHGDYLTVRTARPSELPGLLRAKLAEETTEAITAGDDTLLDELADVTEALHALAAHHGHSPADIEAARAAKAAARGGFQQQLVLDTGSPS
ncbi:nucleoside triphosphate pyrophosphohydrolase [Streptomyces sp. NPDC051994]|uniref:nucleoside triphosphate pyrophosphohydrolase n=1 Tax=Streptomyces sp. NPDC051994 TaxID=3155287 RepID=UPI0034490420